MEETKSVQIIVCCRVIRLLCEERGFDPVKGSVDPDFLVRMVNPTDEHALEMALLLRGRMKAEITVLSVAPPEDEEILRRSLAMGADRACRIWDGGFEALRASATAYVLAAVIRRLQGDLILCGQKAMDTNEMELGGYLAEFLSLPQISGVTALEVAEERDLLICRRRAERMGWDLVKTPTPVVVTTERGENEPRYPTIFSILDWLEKEIPVLNRASLGIDEEILKDWNKMIKVLAWTRPKPKRIFTPPSDLAPEERIRLALTGGLSTKKAKLLTGEAREIVPQLIDVLIKQKFFRGNGEKSNGRG
jgi:electron transfer flavoprotein beta subunit